MATAAYRSTVLFWLGKVGAGAQTRTVSHTTGVYKRLVFDVTGTGVLTVGGEAYSPTVFHNYFGSGSGEFFNLSAAARGTFAPPPKKSPRKSKGQLGLSPQKDKKLSTPFPKPNLDQKPIQFPNKTLDQKKLGLGLPDDQTEQRNLDESD